MERYRVAFYGTAVALAVSLALHVRSTWREPAPPPAPSGPDAPATDEPSASAPASTSQGAAERQCCQQLAQCRKASWDIVERAIEGDLRMRASSKQEGADASAPDATAADTGPDAQRKALCEISKELLRHLWQFGQPTIEEALRNVGNQAWNEQWTKTKLDSLEGDWEFSEKQWEQLEQGYESLLARHGPRLQKIVTSESPDYGALMEAVRGFYKEEDQLYSTLLGEQAMQQYRASELKSRSAVLALVATYAGQPWGDNLLW